MISNLLSNFTEELQSLLFTLPVVLLAIICHECAHGYVSYRLGDPTAKNAGRLTLNPLKHLDPVGTLCMLFFHIGWANPVPINPMYYRNRKKGIICVSLAGPITNFILAFLSLLIQGLLLRFGAVYSKLIWGLCQLCYYSAVVNIGLGTFNLIPLPPLDGSKIVGELSEKAAGFYRRYQQYWRWVLLICIITGILRKPLSILNSFLLKSLWKLVVTIISILF